MSLHLRTQISLLFTEATELLNNKKEFPVPPKIKGQTDEDYKLIIESALEDLTAEQVEIAEISNQLSDVDDKWTNLRTIMTGNERMQDNTEYDAFIITIPFAQTMSDLRRYLSFMRFQRRQLQSAIPLIKNSHTNPATSSLIHLPKTELPSFSGDCISFLSFWNTFKAGVHDLPISDSIKFTYLKQCLTGPPLTLINALPITDESYSIAIELLRKNYDNPTEVARSLHNSLRKLPHVRCGDHFCSDLRNLLDQLEGICVQMSQRNQSYDTTSFQMEVEERLPSFVLDEIFKSKDEDHEWSSLKLKEKLHNILKRKEQIETLTLNSTSLRSPISASSKSPQISKTPNNIPTHTFNTQRDENDDSPPMQTLYNEAQNRITNFSYQTINGYSSYKSSLKNNHTGPISNSKSQLSPNCNGQTLKDIKTFSHKRHKLKPPNKEPLLFKTPLKTPKELCGSNRSSCLPKFQKRKQERQIRPPFPLDRNRPYGHPSYLNHQNHLKNSNVLNPKPGNIPKIAQKAFSPIFAGRERAHRVLPSTYNPIITYPAPVNYKNNFNSTFRNIPPLIPPLFNKIFLPTGVALPLTSRGVLARGEHAPTLRPYQLSPMDSTILLNSYPKQQMYLTYGSIPGSSFMPMDRYAAFA